MTLDRELEVATHLARQAGAVVLRYFRTDLAVEHKQPGDPVTQADRDSEATILDGLRRAFPTHGILSEESAAQASWRPDGLTWLVDPLDGTKDFVAGLDGFSVMIGLLERGRPALGVVHQPTTGLTFVGCAGAGARLLRGDEQIALHTTSVTDVARLRLVVSHSHRDERVDEVKRALGIEDEQRIGSVGLKISLLARAERDLYVHPSGSCKLWDTCAPEAILGAAGGRMTDLHGDPLRYAPGQIRVERGIVASNGACHDEVIRRIARLFVRPG